MLLTNLSYGAAAEPGDAELNPTERYAKAVKHRKHGEFDQAIRLFTPLVESEDVALQQKSKHNLGSCYYHMGEQEKAYFWFKKASSQGFSPSQRNIEKLDLLNILLPPELIEKVVSFLPISSMASFSRTLRRNYHAVGRALSSVDFLTFNDPRVESLFEETEIIPAPKTLRLAKKKIVRDSAVEVHFRDTKHLRSLAKEFSLVSVSLGYRLYYVQDPDTKDGEEFQADDGQATKSEWLFHFESDEPLVVRGRLDLPISLALPSGSNTDGLTFTAPGGLSTGKLKAYANGHALADTLDEFDPDLFHTQTTSAQRLLEERAKHRKDNPHLYPSLMDQCPELLVISSGGSCRKGQGDYIHSASPLFHMARSREEMLDLLRAYPEFKQSILCINCRTDDGFVGSGVYAKEALTLEKYFSIESSGDLVISGVIEIEGLSLYLASARDMHLINNLISGKSVIVESGGSLAMRGSVPSSRFAIDGMPQQYWDFVRVWMRYPSRTEIQLS